MALPTNANSYFYPSVQLAVIFTDALSWRPKWLDYGKIRVSSAKVGNDAPLYALTTRYNNASAVGDDDGRALFANALMLVGRHLATQVSPKAAGVVMN